MKDAVKILQDGKALVEKGWTQGTWKRGNLGSGVSYCMLGAIQEASRGSNKFYEAERYLRSTIEFPFTSVPKYNDAPYRRKRGVLRKFDIAIAQARGLPTSRLALRWQRHWEKRIAYMDSPAYVPVKLEDHENGTTDTIQLRSRVAPVREADRGRGEVEDRRRTHDDSRTH